MASRNIWSWTKLLSRQQQFKYLESCHVSIKRFQSNQKPAEVHDQNAIQPGIVHPMDPFAPIDQAKKQFIEDLRPPMKRSFNLAAYVNDSVTLQELLKLGVSLYDIENTNYKAARFIVNLDFQKDCVPYIKFLVDSGLKPKNLGRFISEFPLIFQEHIDDLQTRINYLESKGFSRKMIAKALNRSAKLLTQKTKTLDFKLGELQVIFHLPARVLRIMVTQHPDIVALPENQYKLVKFTLSAEFGFTDLEIHAILERQPQVLDIVRPVLIERIDLVHNTMGLSHSTLVKFPKLITAPTIDLRQRFQYLQKLSRNQFNPNEPLYVPPSALYEDDDNQFCSLYAKTSLEDYKLFLRCC